jgi:SAM-dependent methyltransferase
MAEGFISAVVKNQLLVIPPVREMVTRRRRARPYTPWKNSLEYVRDVFENASTRIVSRHPVSGSVLEIGPGGNIGATLLFIAAGCDRGVCIDALPLLSDQSELYQDLLPNAEQALSAVEYRCPEAIETTQLPEASFDIIFSAACFEHVLDPPAAIRSVYRLLKPGGATTHSIDLRDHRDFDNPLDFLRYSDRMWSLKYGRRLELNRWRASDWEREFRDAGFEDISIEPAGTHEVDDETRSRMTGRFRKKSVADLEITLINLTAVKAA